MSVEDSGDKADLKCIFCGKTISAKEAVRYSGALSCNDCAMKQEPVRQFNERPYYIAAAIGCLLGVLAMAYATVHAALYAQVGLSYYYPPLDLYFISLIVAVPLQSLGLYALNHSEPKRASLLFPVLGLFACIVFGLSLADFLIAGPSYVTEGHIDVFAKGYSYYPSVGTVLVLFYLGAGCSILLETGRSKIEYRSVAAGGLYLLASGLLLFPLALPPVGFIHSTMYFTALLFFSTKRDVREPQPLETLGYTPVGSES